MRARIDVVTIFPAYLDPLDLSLVGRARRAGLLDVRVHDLRAWATDAHRTVDDTPAGGGAGMVMRPDVWGRALDDVLADEVRPDDVRPDDVRPDDVRPEDVRPDDVRPEDARADEAAPRGEALLLVPTPAGERFTQAIAADLAGALASGARLVVACGRYEGIDARVAEHYARIPGVHVREISIGDYVLGGGEVAALVVVEAVTRLLPGVLGNPESLAEESHGPAGLLEAPVYTRPVVWRDLEVPEPLRSGDHGRIARWRRDRALARTAERRPDLLARLDPSALDRADRRTLARLGWLALDGRLGRVSVRRARPDEAAGLAALAADTFPLACPPGSDPAEIAAHIAASLSEAVFDALLAEPDRYLVVVAEGEPGRRLLGYALAVLPRTPGEEPPDADVGAVVVPRPVAELSKCYVRAEAHGTGVADALLDAVHADLASRTVGGEPVAAVWLGTNGRNRRARRFYARAGYAVVGRRTFRVGREEHDDVVMLRPLS